MKLNAYNYITPKKLIIKDNNIILFLLIKYVMAYLYNVLINTYMNTCIYIHTHTHTYAYIFGFP